MRVEVWQCGPGVQHPLERVVVGRFPACLELLLEL